jgi:hypothetical protein
LHKKYKIKELLLTYQVLPERVKAVDQMMGERLKAVEALGLSNGL